MIKNTIIPLLTILAVAFGAYFYIDDWKADAEELIKTNLTVQQLQIEFKVDKMESRYQWLGDRIFELEEKYRGKRMPVEVSEQLHEYQEERNILEMKLKKYYGEVE